MAMKKEKYSVQQKKIRGSWKKLLVMCNKTMLLIDIGYRQYIFYIKNHIPI